MMKPSIFIGIGGAGFKIGHSLMYHFDQYMPEAVNETVKFIFIENDNNELRRCDQYLNDRTDLKEKASYVMVQGFHGESIRQKIIMEDSGQQQKPDPKLKEMHEWLDTKPSFPVREQVEGLAAMRMLGRMAIYFNWDKVRGSIEDANSALQRRLQKLGSNDLINIYIINGTAGGTGSSIFLDVAAIVDDIIQPQGCKDAFFINVNQFLRLKEKDGFTPASDEYRRLQNNAWAFHTECEFFARHHHNVDKALLARYAAKKEGFFAKLQKGQAFVTKPFTNAFLFDYLCSGNKQIQRNDFYQTIADIIFYTTSAESNVTWSSHIHNNPYEHKKIEKLTYSTIGYKTIMFPATELRKYFEMRYLYEIFSKVLLATELKTELFDEGAVSKFVNAHFQNREGKEGDIFNLTGDEFNRSFAKKDTYTAFNGLIVKERFAAEDKPDTLMGDSAIQESIRYDINQLDALVKDAEKIYDEVTKDLGFNLPYNLRSNVADNLKRIVWEQLYNIVLKSGYYAIVGLQQGPNETKGFLSNLKKLLKDLYLKLGERFETLKSERTRYYNELQRLQTNLVKVSKKTLWGNKKINDKAFEKEFSAYATCLESIRKNIGETQRVKLKMKVLYEFACGDDSTITHGVVEARTKGTFSELSAYEYQLKQALGLTKGDSAYQITLLGTYDDGEQESNSIKAEYLNNLPREFALTAQNAFTTYIPEPLTDYISADGGWRPKSEIDNMYKENISLSNIQDIFQNNPDRGIELLIRFGEDRKKVRQQIDALIGEIKDHFQSTCLNATTPLANFLSMDILAALKETNKKIKENIKNEFRTGLTYPLSLNTAANNPPTSALMNIYDVNVGNGIAELLGTDVANIEINPKYEKNKVCYVSLIKDIEFDNVKRNDLCQIIYQNRNIEAERPHLHKDWNNYREGIMHANFQPKEFKALPSEMSGMQDLFMLSFIIDELSQSDKKLKNTLFLKEKANLDRFMAVAKPPVYFDEKSYYFINKSELPEVEDGQEKFALVAGVRGTANRIKLPLSRANIDFSKTIDILKNDVNAPDVFNNFSTIILKNNREIISSSIKKYKNNLLKSAMIYQKIIEKPKIWRESSEEDQVFATNFQKNISDFIKKIFDVDM